MVHGESIEETIENGKITFKELEEMLEMRNMDSETYWQLRDVTNHYYYLIGVYESCEKWKNKMMNLNNGGGLE